MKTLKHKRWYIALAIVLISMITLFILAQPRVIDMKSDYKMADSYTLALDSSWKHPEKPTDIPVPFLTNENTYVDSNKCIIEIANNKLDNNNGYKNDFDASYQIAFPYGAPVLRSLSNSSLFKVPVKNDGLSIEMIQSSIKTNYMSFFIDSEHSNIVTLNRVNLKAKTILQIAAACPTDSNINPASMLNKISINSVK